MNKTIACTRLDFLSIKEYLNAKQLLLYAAVILVIGMLIRYYSFSFGILMMYSLFYSSYPFITSEKTQGDLLYRTLPFTVRDLVRGRYLFALVINVASALIAVVVSIIMSFAFKQNLDPMELVFTGGLLLLAVTFIEFIQLPMYFKLGYSKAKFLSMLPFMLLPLGVFAVVKLMEDPGIAARAERLVEQVVRQPLPFILVLIVVWLVFYVISSRLSRAFYTEREF